MGARPVTKAEDILQSLNLQNIEQFVNNKKMDLVVMGTLSKGGVPGSLPGTVTVTVGGT